MEQLLYWLVGGIGMPLIQWLKSSFNLSGAPAMWLTLGVSLLLALAALFFAQEISPADFSPATFFAALGQVLAAATLAYKLLLGEPLPIDLEP